jgi:hypothetical protein
MKTPMKLATGILAMAVMAGAAWAQNTDAIDQARSIAKSLQQKQDNDTNAALDAAGVKAKPAPGAPAPAVKPAVIPGSKPATAQTPAPAANPATKPVAKTAAAPTTTKAAVSPAQANPAQANPSQGKAALPINPAGTMVVNGPVYGQGQGAGGKAMQANAAGNSAQGGAGAGRWKSSGNRPAGAEQGKWARKGAGRGGMARPAGPPSGAVMAAKPVTAPAVVANAAKAATPVAAVAPAGTAADASKIGDTAKPKAEDKKWAMNGKRDPFFSPVVQQQGGSGCATGKKCLEIGNINLRGVVKSDAGFIAVVTNNLNKAYFLRENDPVFNGYVVRITGDSVVFQETVQDKLGKQFTREVVKRIFTPAV